MVNRNDRGQIFHHQLLGRPPLGRAAVEVGVVIGLQRQRGEFIRHVRIAELPEGVLEV